MRPPTSKQSLLAAGAFAAVIFALQTVTARAQDAKYSTSTGTIEVDLGTADVTPKDIERIYLRRSSTADSKSFEPGQIGSAGGTGLTSHILTINPGPMPANLNVDAVWLDIIVKPKAGDDPPRTTVLSIRVEPVGVRTTYAAMRDRLKLEIAEAEGEEDAELYLSGQTTVAVGSSPNWTVDAKYEPEFGNGGFPFLVAPFVNLEYNSKVKGDTDKFNVGVKFSNSFGFASGGVDTDRDRRLSLVLEDPRADKTDPKFTKLKRSRDRRQYFLYTGSVEFESDWDFRVNNIITSQEVSYLFRPVFLTDSDGAVEGKLTFTPFVGTELGGNLKNPTGRGDYGISRLKAGVTLTLNLDRPFGRFFVKKLTWENRFTQRWFLADEIAYDKNDDDVLEEKAFGMGPRSHFKSSLQFKVNDYFGPSLEYEWGEEPPLYNLVNHKLKFGLVYSFKRKALPE